VKACLFVISVSDYETMADEENCTRA